MYEVTADQPSEPTLTIAEGTRSKEEIVSFRLPEATPPVSFGMAGELAPHRGSVSRKVLTLPGGKDVVLTAIDLRADGDKGGSFRGRWESPKPTAPNPHDMGYGGSGSIDSLPAGLREALLKLLTPLTGKPTEFSLYPRFELGADAVLGKLNYPAALIEKRSTADGSVFVLLDGSGKLQRAILKSTPGLGDEYLIPTSSQSTVEVATLMLKLGILEDSGLRYFGAPVLSSVGKFQEFTGVGFDAGDSLQS